MSIPIQSVLLTRVADELLSILLYAVAIVCLAEVLLLSVGESQGTRRLRSTRLCQFDVQGLHPFRLRCRRTTGQRNSSRKGIGKG